MTFVDAVLGSLALAVLVLGGMAILSLIDAEPWGLRWPGRIALAHLAGSAAMAWVVTAVAIATRHLLVLPAYLLLAGFVWLAWRRGKISRFLRTSLPLDVVPDNDGGPWRAFVIASLLLGVLCTAWNLTGPALMSGDAYWNWALKAKVLFLTGSLHPIARNCCLKPNYPIFSGLQSWWIFEHLRHVSDRWPQIVSFLFYLDTVVIVFDACRASMRSTWAWMAATLIANDTYLTFFAPRAQPDSMLAAFFLASSLFLARYFAGRRVPDKVCAMLMLLGAIQSKNEGLVWTTLAVAMIAASEIKWQSYRRALITVACFFAAAAPWTWFKLRNHMTSGPEEPMASAATLKLEWAMRIKQIVLAHLLDLRPTGFMFLLLLCVPLIVRRWSSMSKPVLALIGLQFASYFVVYFVVADPAYQLKFANRAHSQLAAALLCTCLIGYFSTHAPAQDSNV